MLLDCQLRQDPFGYTSCLDQIGCSLHLDKAEVISYGNLSLFHARYSSGFYQHQLLAVGDLGHEALESLKNAYCAQHSLHGNLFSSPASIKRTGRTESWNQMKQEHKIIHCTSNEKGQINLPIFVGIAGGSGAGKSTLVDMMIKKLSEEHHLTASSISLDYFYKPLVGATEKQRTNRNYDEPKALDFELFKSKLDELATTPKGEMVEVPFWLFSSHTRSADTKKVPVTDVIFFDGILLFTDQEVRDRLDYRVFVDSPKDARTERRVDRDELERNRSREESLEQIRLTVDPGFEDHVFPTRIYAHHTISGSGDNSVHVVEVVTAIAKMNASTS